MANTKRSEAIRNVGEMIMSKLRGHAKCSKKTRVKTNALVSAPYVSYSSIVSMFTANWGADEIAEGMLSDMSEQSSEDVTVVTGKVAIRTEILQSAATLLWNGDISAMSVILAYGGAL